jgi:hypothetical protein
MEEPKSSAGQGLGIAGLILGILAIPMGIIPCTFVVGILFGIIGIVLSLVALSQANRGFGPKGLIIAALVCSIVGLTFASVWGFAFSKMSSPFIREMFKNGIPPRFEDFQHDENVYHDIIVDTAAEKGSDMGDMTDTLKALEGEDSIR